MGVNGQSHLSVREANLSFGGIRALKGVSFDVAESDILAANNQIIDPVGLTPADRHLAALPLFHITGLGLSLATAAAGGANVVTPAFDPGVSAQMIDRHGVTLMADFPPVLQMLLEARGEAKWEKLRIVFGLDSPEMIQKLQSETGAKFWTGFGQAETTGAVTLGPAEVEHVILDLPEVAAVCVIGVPDDRYGEAVKAVVELEPGDSLTADAISQAVADQIALFKKPRLVEFVAALPRTETGKVDRSQVNTSFSET